MAYSTLLHLPYSDPSRRFLTTMDSSIDGVGLQSLTTHLTSIVVGFFGFWLLYRLALGLYNISPLHPLYQFPGPRLAAMTSLYEFWFDFVLLGRYTREIERMHHVYGPIVRISPEELHCNDPDFTDEIYAGSGRVRDKHQHFLDFMAGPVTNSCFGSRDHEVHRMRRSAVSKSFSRTRMRTLEPEVWQLTREFCDKLLGWTNRAPLDLSLAFSCFTSDVISQYAYGESHGFVAQDGWDQNYKYALDAIMKTVHIFRFLTPLRNLVHLAPYVQRWLPVDIANLFREQAENIPRHIRKATEGDAKTKGRIFADLLDSGLPDSEKTMDRLSGEGLNLMAAGTETTAPETRARLEEELKGTDPTNLDWTSLEQLPYLYGVIQEGLRLGYGLSQRLPRIARYEDLLYQQRDGKHAYVIPQGTPIGMSATIMHHNEAIFPDSHSFLPERWIDETGRHNYRLDKYLMSFSRGSRQCLGMNLALCELYLVVAALTMHVLPRMELDAETTELDNIKYDHDCMVPKPRSSRGVRVTIS